MRRVIVASFAGALAVPLLLVALRALGAPWWAAAPVAVAAAVFGARALARRVPSTVDELLGPRVRLVAWCVLATVAVAQTARLSVFMLDAGRQTCAIVRSPFTPDVYATFGTLWLLTLVVVDRAPGWRSAAWFAAAWLLLNVYYPIGARASLRVLMLITLLPQAASYAVLAATAWRLARPRKATGPVSPRVPASADLGVSPSR